MFADRSRSSDFSKRVRIPGQTRPGFYFFFFFLLQHKVLYIYKLIQQNLKFRHSFAFCSLLLLPLPQQLEALALLPLFLSQSLFNSTSIRDNLMHQTRSLFKLQIVGKSANLGLEAGARVDGKGMVVVHTFGSKVQL